MKKILLLLLCMFLFDANATEMCARDDTVVVPLDAVAGVDSNSFNQTEYMWRVKFDYGNVYGTSTCLSLQEIEELDPSYTIGNSIPTVLPVDDDEIMGRTGTDASGTVRNKCFIKMTHPMSSKWVFSDSVACSNCLNGSMHLMRQQSFRSELFNSVLQ